MSQSPEGSRPLCDSECNVWQTETKLSSLNPPKGPDLFATAMSQYTGSQVKELSQSPEGSRPLCDQITQTMGSELIVQSQSPEGSRPLCDVEILRQLKELDVLSQSPEGSRPLCDHMNTKDAKTRKPKSLNPPKGPDLFATF